MATSFTSPSDSVASAYGRAPDIGFAVPLAALSIGILLLATWQVLLWRIEAAAPIDTNNEAFIRNLYIKSRGFDGSAVACIGSSRTEFGVSPAAVAGVAGVDAAAVTNLGISAGSPIPVFRAIAEDPHFSGTVVFEVFQLTVFADCEGGLQDTVVRAIDRPLDYQHLEMTVGTETRLALPALDHRLGPLPFLRWSQRRARSLKVGSPFGADFSVKTTVHHDRWRDARGATTGSDDWLAEERASEKVFALRGKMRSVQGVNSLLDDLEFWERQIRARGGAVLFVAMPTSGLVRAVEAERFPRASCFRLFEERFPGRCRHFEDFDELRDLRCFDGSHLSTDGARTYSRWLGGQVKQLREP